MPTHSLKQGSRVTAPRSGGPRGSLSRAPQPPRPGRVAGSAAQAPLGRSLPRQRRPKPEAFEAAAPRGPSRGGPGLQLPAAAAGGSAAPRQRGGFGLGPGQGRAGPCRHGAAAARGAVAGQPHPAEGA